MPKYKVEFNGELQDEVFDTWEKAESFGLYLGSCAREGAEILHMSNPFEYDEDDYEDDYDVIEIED